MFGYPVPKIERLTGAAEWIDWSVVEVEWSPRDIATTTNMATVHKNRTDHNCVVTPDPDRLVPPPVDADPRDSEAYPTVEATISQELSLDDDPQDPDHSTENDTSNSYETDAS